MYVRVYMYIFPQAYDRPLSPTSTSVVSKELNFLVLLCQCYLIKFEFLLFTNYTRGKTKVVQHLTSTVPRSDS